MKRLKVLKFYLKQLIRHSPSQFAIHGKITLKNVIQGRTQADDFREKMYKAVHKKHNLFGNVFEVWEINLDSKTK
ncbi:hypothetical protein [Streptococcus parauberis]|uniref:hypothetical protein n=1 Tax=Streptococcus parauberis TaxID=1348 RepID=UPI000E307CC9|nr:hypothetical protein [Streptococcus parauberis]RFE01083.1 hypothetical protein ADO06_01956 [Streptococcus parauberis]